MNTKLFNSFAAAAMSVLAIACAKEPVGGGTEAGVSFSIEVPGAQTTKAIGDGETAKTLYYQVFDKDGAAIEGLGVQTASINGKTATVKFQLVKDQEYSFVFWAQTSESGYYEVDADEGLKKITANYTDKKANDENFDAFYAVKKMTVTGPVSETVKLTRPFAQINIATEGKISAGNTTKDIDFTDAASAVTVKGIPTVFAPLATADVFTGNADVTFAKAEVPAGDLTVNSKDYKYLAVNYVFAPVDGTVYDLNATLTIEGKDVNLTVPTVPAKQNWRTNIVGDLLTAGADFTVVVDPVFGGDQNVAYDEAALRSAVSKGGTVVVSKDVTVKDKSLKPNEGTELNLVVSENATLTGELTGHEYKLINLFNRNVQCTISGEGTIVGPKCERSEHSAAVELEDKANTCVIDGNVTFKGAEGTKSGKCDACVIIRDGKVVVNGGHFIASKDIDGNDNPAILLYASANTFYPELVINGGTFESVLGNSKFLINKNADNISNCTIKIYGGTFIGFDPADNEADGAHTNYVAEGYHSTKVSTDSNGVSTYVVSKDGTIPVVNQEGFKDAVAQENATVLVPAGTFAAPSSVADGVTIEGVDGTVIDIPAAVAYHNKNVTFKSLSVKSPNANYTGIQHAASVKYVDCTIEGQPFSYATEAVYENCRFVQTSSENYNIWTYASNATFNKCTFESAGRSALVYRENGTAILKVTFNECKFYASSSVVGKAAIEIDSSLAPFEVYINNCTATGFSNGSKSGNTLWNNKKGDSSNLKVVVDGVEQTLN